MEYYMLFATDADDAHEARMGARAGHLQRLEALKAEGRLLIAGPNPLPDNPERFSGSLIVAQKGRCPARPSRPASSTTRSTMPTPPCNRW